MIACKTRLLFCVLALNLTLKILLFAALRSIISRCNFLADLLSQKPLVIDFGKK